MTPKSFKLFDINIGGVEIGDRATMCIFFIILTIISGLVEIGLGQLPHTWKLGPWPRIDGVIFWLSVLGAVVFAALIYDEGH